MSTFIELGGGSGGGDMYKVVYDPQNTGIVLSARKEMVEVINKTGSPILEGTIVYLKSTSSSGTHPEILLADADTEATSSKTLGAVYETIANNATGYVVTSGEVDNLDTSMYNIGDKLWLSQTAGQVTTTPPVQPAHTVFIGTVTRSQNGNGRILYAIQNGYELNELHNVLISASPANNEVLMYESSTALWKNKPVSGGSGTPSGFHAAIPFWGIFGFATSAALNCNSNTNINSSNQIWYNPFVPNTDFTCGSFTLNLISASAGVLGRIAVYSSSVNGTPENLLYSSVDLDFSTIGAKTVASSFVFTKGTVYWLALQMNSTGASVTAISNSALMQIGNNAGNPITSWIQVGVTFSSGAPTLASPNSFQTQGAPLIRMTKL